MEIGGIAKRLNSPVWADSVDALLRVCRAVWPQAVFRNASETTDYLLNDWLRLPKLSSGHEFFVCQDSKASASWDLDGPTADNVNTMLHFIVQERTVGSNRPISVIYDENTPEMNSILAALEAAVNNLWGGAEIIEAA